jgi:hypothetical protein
VWIYAERNNSVSIIPYINLATPEKAIMYYDSGNGTANIVFKYIVRVPDYSETGISWDLGNDWKCILVGGHFIDYLGNSWNVTAKAQDLSQMDGRIIDSNSGIVVLVNSTNPDGIYYPGEAIDITITFNCKVAIFGNNLPQVAVFVPHQEGENVLANYKSGNKTEELHFEYVVPLPNNHVALHPMIFFDVSGIISIIDIFLLIL